ncbi:MAG TPA: RNA methyltransferase [Thermodesulforhabdus norvegica]|uniref:RNA methyltransferase n=1 Tax=Thermodesulforhabdus norvegica TaxID=39841 RepID=A0A7C0WT36_9BACT|nr:RNA methyltransferase [Thermodesulforhabdus norvegica]
MSQVYIGLVHYPVLNRKNEVIASAITSIDLHDLGRLACTYDLPTCYIITPLVDQQDLAKRLIKYWCEGTGKEHHPNRAEALELLKLVNTTEEAVEDIGSREGVNPEIWATSARKREKKAHLFTYREARIHLASSSNPVLLLFGTAWGLAPDLIEKCDRILTPILGKSNYNHLSVRCAAAIILDRLLGREDT